MAWREFVRMYGPGAAWMTSGFAASFSYMYPYTVGFDRYKEKMTDKSEYSSNNIDSEVLMAEKIKRHFKWRPTIFHIGPDIQIIQSKQLLDISHHGSVQTRWGAFIGLPVLFTTSSLQSAKENPIDFFQRYNFDVDFKQGQQILDLFELSPSAKKFALAREICHVNTTQLYFNGGCILLAFMSCYAITHALTNVIPYRGASLISFLVVPVIGYLFTKVYDSYNCYIQGKSDVKAASIDEDVANGGVEYYNTLITCRQALENLKSHISSTEIKSKFDMSWRKTELSLEERRDRLREKLNK